MSDFPAEIHLPPIALLRLLADGRLHSGQELALVLGVSRTAIWKQLAKLEALGLELQSQARKGYCLPGGLDLLEKESIRKGLTPQVNKAIDQFELFEILDCYTEMVTYDLKWPTYRDKSTTWPYNTTTYGNPTATTTTNGAEITTSNPAR
jgi:biotin operon repressor BirA-like protein